MKRFSNIRTLMLTIVLLLGTIPVTATERAFACNGNGLLSVVTDEAGHVIGGNFTGSGTATHLGMWTIVGTVQFTPDPNNPTLVHPSGTSTFTAADGDKLDIVLADGVMDVTTGIAKGSLHFSGGTGRFAEASGTTSYVVTQNFVTGAFQLTCVGSINF